ncbi:MAG: transposase [Opitutaceae bacterium]
MKTQLQKPARGKASYTEEYRQQALELWRKSGRSAAQVAAELGIRPSLLYKWSTDARQAGEHAKQAKHRARLRAERAAWSNWRRRTAGCARRTPNSWSSVKS